MLYRSTLKEQLLQEWIEEIKADDELLDELKIMYEWGYKYDMLKQGMTANNEKRITNVLRQIHMRMNPIFKSIADKLMNVFEDWLSKHALDKPELWAKARYEEIKYDSDTASAKLESMKYEYEKYADGDFYEQAFEDVYTYLESDLNELKDSIVDDYRTQAEEAEYDDNEEDALDFNNRVEEVEALDMKKYDDVIDFLDNHFYQSPQEFLEGSSNDFIMTLIYEETIFPVWFDHWKAEGIVQTRKKVIETFKSLKKVKTEKDFSKKIVVLNMALSQVHQTGTFIDDYIYPMYSVNKNDLDKLSNVSDSDLKAWNKEIGMNL